MAVLIAVVATIVVIVVAIVAALSGIGNNLGCGDSSCCGCFWREATYLIMDSSCGG